LTSANSDILRTEHGLARTSHKNLLMDFLKTCAAMSSFLESKSVCCILFDLDVTLYDSPSYSGRLEVEIVKVVSEMLTLPQDQAMSILGERRRMLHTLTRALQSLGINREVFFQAIANRVDPHSYLSEDPVVREVIEQVVETTLSVTFLLAFPLAARDQRNRQ